MRILLTGATGLIGRAVLSQLLDAGHDVTAVVRSTASADAVAAAGATPLEGDLFDSAWVAKALTGVDAAIHTAEIGRAHV